jgi:hypothetical protein
MTVTDSENARDLRSAFGLDRYERALGTSRAWLLRSVLDQIASGDATRLASLADADALLIQQALLVAELMALEHLDDAESASRSAESTFLRTACSDAFYLLRALPKSSDADARRKILLRLSCYGILGDRSADVRRWLREQGLPDLPAEPEAWPRRVFGTVADSFLRIARKDGWTDLHEVARGIAELRQLQTQFERDFLAGVGASAQVAALELVSLYHLAKAVELLGTFCGKGSPKDIVSELKFHYLRAIRAASTGGLVELDVLLRWMRAASIQIAQNSIWWLLRSFNSRISEHVRHLASEDVARPLLELLPPQRRALLEDGLLDPAHRAVVVQMPTSSGKTLLAEFRILQAINSFPGCWIAYLVPTRALVNQIALRLRRDLEPLGLTVESAAPVQEVDVFEEEWLTSAEAANVVVTTPEKLDLVIRGAKRRPAQRPLGLVILDEAHNIGEAERGVRAELLLAMLNQEYPDAQFLLLTPFVPNGQELAVWLDDQRSRAITVLAADWQPNDRAIGMVYPEGRARDWALKFRTLHTQPAGIETAEPLSLNGGGPVLDLTVSAVRASKSKIAAAAAQVLSRRAGSTCIVLADSPRTAWNIADILAQAAETCATTDRVELVKRFAETEIAPTFKLRETLDKGIAVHHGGLSPELRFLVEWLTEEGDVRILVATTTLAQGVNFPVSSIVLATHFLYQPNRGKVEMSPAAFRNLAGRAGRLFQDTLGIVAFAAQERDDAAIEAFVTRQVQQLVSVLETMVIDVLDRGWDLNLTSLVRHDPRWASFAQYLAHAYRQAGDHERFVADTEKILRATWGYRRLSSSRPAAAEQLVDATRQYAETLQRMGPGILSLVDSTGFSGETLMEILQRRELLPSTADGWSPSELFRAGTPTLAGLFEILIGVRELQLDVPAGTQHRHLAEVLSMWVEGRPVGEIAAQHFQIEGADATASITQCCRQLFQRFSQAGAWGLGALQALSGIDTSGLPPEQSEAFRSVPAMVFYGVPTVNAVLMRALGVPRSIAVPLGDRFAAEASGGVGPRVVRARTWLKDLPSTTWEEVKPAAARMSGDDYRRIWRILNGMGER